MPYRYKIYFLFLITLVYVGCRPTRRLGENQYLIVEKSRGKLTNHLHKELKKKDLVLKTNVFIVDKKSDLNTNDLYTLIKTKPNRKILGVVKFHLWLYNLFDTARVSRIDSVKRIKGVPAVIEKNKKIEEKNKKIEAENIIRKEKGKKPKKLKEYEEYKPHWRKRFATWITTKVGEPPIVLDTGKVKASVKNLNLYLFKKGYFDNEVSDTILLDSANKKARVFYFIKPKTPYYIDTISYISEDKKILKQINYVQDQTLVKKDDKLDIDVLDEERARITTYLRDKGYYYFNKDYIVYRVDSALNSHKVKLTMIVKQVPKKHAEGDSTYYENHKKYTINKIYIYTDYQDTRELENYDTIIRNEHIFVYTNNWLHMKPQNLLQHIYINSGYTYRSKEVESTYKKLTSLGIYKSINIIFEENKADPNNPALDCFILMKPLKRQIYVFESNLTNRGGNRGISGDISYRNKNLFRGAESFKISLSGGIEAQQTIGEDPNEENENLGVINDVTLLKTFNTIEFGPEVSLTIPKFFFPGKFLKFEKNASPKTVFTASLNFQHRPDFTRGIQEASLAYDWRKGKRKKGEDASLATEIGTTIHAFYLSPLKLSAVKIYNKSADFQERLDNIADPLFKYSYSDHIILGLQGAYTYNTQFAVRRKHVLFLKFGFDQSGMLLRDIFTLTNQPKDSVGRFQILNIPFAHYVKTDCEFRYAISFNKSSQIVYRTFGGIGIPLKNSVDALPFEKSYFVGGSNGLRAWKARTLGPGTFFDPTGAYDKIGDIILEGNLEYRFDLLKVIKGALFCDAGNIWLLRPNSGKPGGEITSNFYKEIAIGAGVGLRFDLDFFIFRLDFAYPLRNPSLPEGERWSWEPKDEINQYLYNYSLTNSDYTYSPYKSRINLNIGIGYPF